MDNVKLVAKDCSRVYTPTQRGGVCWFAALVMTIFFSQRMRGVSASHAKLLIKKNDWKSPIAEAMMKIMMNYEINSLDKDVVGKLEPRAFLRALRRYDPVYFDSKSGEVDEGAPYGPYQHKLFAFMEIPHLSVTVPRGSTEAVYSAYNFDLPVDEKKWKHAVKTLDPKGAFVDTDNPEVIVVHREAGESYLQKAWITYRPKMYEVKGINLTRHPEKIVYNKRVYVLDSCILPSYISNACSLGHAIAGVTCNGDKYVYNGWAARSGDPAMGGAAITREMPCALMKSDWAADKAFCVDTNSCSITKAKKNEFCFDAFKRSSVVYVRDDSQKNIPEPKRNAPKIAPNKKNIPKVLPGNKAAQLNALKKRIQERK